MSHVSQNSEQIYKNFFNYYKFCYLFAKLFKLSKIDKVIHLHETFQCCHHYRTLTTTFCLIMRVTRKGLVQMNTVTSFSLYIDNVAKYRLLTKRV